VYVPIAEAIAALNVQNIEARKTHNIFSLLYYEIGTQLVRVPILIFLKSFSSKSDEISNHVFKTSKPRRRRGFDTNSLYFLIS